MLFLVRAEYETKYKLGGDLPDNLERLPIRSTLKLIVIPRVYFNFCLPKIYQLNFRD